MPTTVSVHFYGNYGDRIETDLLDGYAVLRMCAKSGDVTSVFIDSLDDARALAAGAVRVLDHLRSIDGEPITMREAV